MLTFNLLAPCVVVALALAGCSVQQPATPDVKSSNVVTPQTQQAPPTTSADAAAGTQLTGTPQVADADVGAPSASAGQGFAIGEPNPNGGRVAGTAAIITPCQQEFLTIDANGDGLVDAKEWALVKGDADFKAMDKDGDGLLSPGEYGCNNPTSSTGKPDGKG